MSRGRPAEPWAQSALLAAIVGLVSVLLKQARIRLKIALACSIAVVVSLWLLASSPGLRKAGFFQIDPQIGYWLALGLSTAGAAWYTFMVIRAGPESVRSQQEESGPASIEDQ